MSPGISPSRFEAPVTEPSDRLACFLVVETARQSAGLRQYFIEQAVDLGTDDKPSALPASSCWPVLTADEVSLGFAMATNVIRNAGFPAEAAQLSVLSEVHGHA